MTHSIIPPSSAGVWGKPGGCTGWVLMNQTYPEVEETLASREGTASHEIGEQIITDAKTNKRQRHTVDDWVGITASNGVVFDESMFEGAKLYADDVISVMTRCGVYGGDALRIEQRVQCPSIHDLSNGTPDCVLYDMKSDTLYLWDYKFGFGVVEAFENWQGLNYLSGLIGEMDLSPKTKIKLRIVQPRAHHRDGPIREWSFTASDALPYFDTLKVNAHKALGPDAEFHSGDHCRYCPGRHACPAALKAGVNLYEVSTAPTPVELSPEALGVQLAIVKRARKQLEYLESGFEEQVKTLIRGGASIQGWTTEEGFGREKWNKGVGEVIALGDMLNFDLRKPESAVTPNQARKLGVDDAVIMAYSAKPSTGQKIVPDNGSKAKQVFSK